MSGSVRKVFTIALTGLRRMFRERANIFFVLIFPVLLVLVIGTVFGSGFRPGLGVVAPGDDRLATDLVHAMDRGDEVEVHRYESVKALRSAVSRGSVRAGVVIPKDYGDRLRQGSTSTVEFINRPDGRGAELRQVVQSAIDTQSIALQAAQFAVTQGGAAGFDQAVAEATEQEANLQRTRVRTMTVGEELFSDDLGAFGQGASSQVLLFMFVNGLATSAALIQSRQLGVSRRMLSTPTSATVILCGEALGRFLIVAFQGIYIVTATSLLFGVDWGNPLAAFTLLTVFGLVATGAAMLAGALFRNDQQAGSIGVMVGLGLAALGGCMAPLQIFSPTMRKIAHVTPHAWALDGFDELISHHATVLDILPDLAVLAAMAAVLLTLGTHQLRRAITRS
ncbi:MAG TPA: ABC transporter permease [Acidimicrobiales bacterium]